MPTIEDLKKDLENWKKMLGKMEDRLSQYLKLDKEGVRFLDENGNVINDEKIVDLSLAAGEIKKQLISAQSRYDRAVIEKA